MDFMSNQISQIAIDTIRTLSIDAINQANSGHPGMPMGAAPMGYALFAHAMNHNPKNPTWLNRDRFILSAGHGSMLLYSLLHLSGYGLTIEDLKQFRQENSLTPGHPEYGHTVGVEATTGPLGQGISMAVGMAMAERHLAATYYQDQFPIIDHYTFAIVGDGDLMEGVSSEASSLAGHLKLGRLVVLYDSNSISLDGDLSQSMTEIVSKRYEAYGWQYIRIEDGNDLSAILQAIEEAKADLDHPTLIEVRTVIGYGSPNMAGTSAVHGAPLGTEETVLTKEAYQWSHEPFFVPEEVYADFENKAIQRGAETEAKWQKMFADYETMHPQKAAQLKNAVSGKFTLDWETVLPVYETGSFHATRNVSGEVINELAKALPQFIGGSADLAGSNKTLIKNEKDFLPDSYDGRNIWFGVREFAMGAALNGMALHGGIKVYGGTFFVFSDYIRPAMRLSALMKLPVTFVFTHDSIAVGEDGPTHEPIEHLAAFRAMPGLSVIRPADANETVAAWRLAVESIDTPTALVLTRQNLPTLAGTTDCYENVKRGAYIVSKEAKNTIDAILIATGSEVSLAVQAQAILQKEGMSVRVVSMPSWDLFEKQSDSYRQSVLPKEVTKRVTLEMGATLGWHKYAGTEGYVLGIDRFGESAPGNLLVKKYGFYAENVVRIVKEL